MIKKSLEAFLYKAVAENYRQQDLDNQAIIEKELKAIQENNEWELMAQKMFSSAIETNETLPEVPFDTTDDMGKAIVSVIKKALKERKLDGTTKRLLEDHNMSVPRFLELYGN